MFYSSARRTRQQTRTCYIVPPSCSDSDIEVEADMLDDDVLDDVLDDDDSLDPDFLLNLPDDLTPTSSGKQ